MKNALLIFVRNPEKGKVKTRLAATLGNDMAYTIYNFLLVHIYRVSLPLVAVHYVYYSDFVDEYDIWTYPHFQKKIQQGDDLGIRMANAFQEALRYHQKAVIIGSDCAALEAIHLELAFLALDNHDIVIGPALDGGYYLLGMKTFFPTLFQNIEWSTASVFSETVKRINFLQKSYFTLPTLSDIDTEADWNRFLKKN